MVTQVDKMLPNLQVNHIAILSRRNLAGIYAKLHFIFACFFRQEDVHIDFPALNILYFLICSNFNDSGTILEGEPLRIALQVINEDYNQAALNQNPEAITRFGY
jgi:hypothetical protein